MTRTAPLGDAKYFAATLTKDTATTWKATWADEEPDVRTETNIVVASPAKTATSVELTATVTPSDAAGKVQFTKDGVDIEGALRDVSGGTATYTVTGLTAATPYSFGAKFIENDAYKGSTATAIDVTTEPGSTDPSEPSDSSESVIAVTVPDVNGGSNPSKGEIRITTKPQAVALTGSDTREEGAAWTATGNLENVTVTDNRQEAATSWTLNGSATNFTGSDNKVIEASNLGWKPEKVDGAGTAGDQATDLSSDKKLAGGTGSAEVNVTTTVKAGLTLTVPGDKKAGSYTSTLTLTLI